MKRCAGLVALSALLGCGGGAPPELPVATIELPPAAAMPTLPPAVTAAVSAPSPPIEDRGDGLTVQDLVVGHGDSAEKGDRISVHYVGTLEDKTEFDSSRVRGRPFEIELGKGGVIQGWERGIPGMRVGGKRRLVIPPELAYGPSGRPPKIPPNATLIFEVELLAVIKK